MIKKRYLFLILIISLFTVSAVCGEDSTDNIIQAGESNNDIIAEDSPADFDELQNEINSIESGEVLNLTKNYRYSNSSAEGIEISKPITINGNNFTIDGNGQSRIFNVLAENVTLNNLRLINGRSDNGGAVFVNQSISCNNLTFENNYATNYGGALYVVKHVNLTDCIFDGNWAVNGASLYLKSKFQPRNDTPYNESYNDTFDYNYTFNDNDILDNDTLDDDTEDDDSTPNFDTHINRVIFKNSSNYTLGAIFIGYETNTLINNTVFTDLSSEYCPAIYLDMYVFFNISNTKFINLSANKSGGAIAFISSVNGALVNCSFINTKANKNGGALYIDENSWNRGSPSTIDIYDSRFSNCSSDFGGAIAQAGGCLNIYNSNFTDNTATYSGGAVYTSSLYDMYIIDSIFSNNKLINADIEGLSFGGAVYADFMSVHINSTEFTNNSRGLYLYDCEVEVYNSVFKDNGEAISSIYTKSIDLNNNTYNNDTVIKNDTDKFLNLIVNGTGIKLVLLNNTIDVDNLPKRYNSADWGWVSSIKNQGAAGACWCFSTLAALETALLKATGVEYSLSTQNTQKMLLIYSKYGNHQMVEAGQTDIALQYVLSWFGVFPEEYDTFDMYGKITRFIQTPENIHIQDAVLLHPEKSDINDYKETILKYGSVTTDILIDNSAPYFNNITNALYYNKIEEELEPNHAVAIVGWDDNYPADNFLITPHGNGAWIIKNSYGNESYDNGYIYVSYYDTMVIKKSIGVAFVVENTENYTKNYQTDMGGEVFYKTDYDNYSYKNSFKSQGNDLISAVGTYFYNASQEYSLEIYVNNVLKLTQNGTSPFSGFHTIRLTKEILVKTDDNFTVIMTTSSMPILNVSRIHFPQNTSFVNVGDGWRDVTLDNMTVVLKVYTKDSAIYGEDLVKIYKNDSKFEADIGIANKTVKFEINGIVYARTSDENGIAKMAINLNPGNYTIKTSFNESSIENSIEVLPTLIGDNLVKYFKNESQFYISLIGSTGQAVSNAKVTMNINGVLYTHTTNENGTAKLNINLSPGEYILTATDPLTGLMMSYNITVLSVLNASDVNMTYGDGSSFEVKLLDGTGSPLGNAQITFNIDGTLFTKNTNSSGIASLSINLMPGEYIITSQYESLAISNKITVFAKED